MERFASDSREGWGRTQQVLLALSAADKVVMNGSQEDKKDLTSDGAGFPDNAKAMTLGNKEFAWGEAGFSGMQRRDAPSSARLSLLEDP